MDHLQFSDMPIYGVEESALDIKEWDALVSQYQNASDDYQDKEQAAE